LYVTASSIKFPLYAAGNQLGTFVPKLLNVPFRPQAPEEHPIAASEDIVKLLLWTEMFCTFQRQSDDAGSELI
jgi:hypothetical protein